LLLRQAAREEGTKRSSRSEETRRHFYGKLKEGTATEATHRSAETCMIWTDIRQRYPHQWLLVEALLAHSQAGKRQLEQLAVVDAFPDGEAALRSYLRLHRDAPQRELYVVHSDREELEITERTLLGLRVAG
jgi:hypothetical protein